MRKLSRFLFAPLAVAVLACSDSQPTVTWEPAQVDFQASLRGLSVVDEQSAWASGSGGSYALTRNGGASWVVGIVNDAGSLDFRDVEGFPDGTAFLMSAGNGPQSRIYKTTDWGESWTLQHTNPLENGFYNGMAFWNQNNGVVVGDPVDGTLFLLSTTDGGSTWERLTGAQIPRVLEGEYGFAASGTNITTFGDSGLAIVSGGPVARVFRTQDRGGSWTVSSTPLASGNASSGVFSIAFRSMEEALAVGGDYQAPEVTSGTVAYSSDGGASWALAPEPHAVGFRSGVAWRNDPNHPMWVAVGTSGSSYSLDHGRTWANFDGEAFNAVAFSGSVGFAAGPEGRIARLVVN